MSVSRDPIRKAFADLLETALVGSGLPGEAVYDYQVADFAGRSPVVVVSSGPIERERVFGGCENVTVTLYVYSFVVYADRASGWDEADAEDAIDAIETAIAAVVMDPTHSLNTGGHTCAYADGPTLIDGVEIGGVEYRREIISVQVEVRE